jgi:prephenate dehydratase
MAQTCKAMTYFAFSLPHQPGALASFARQVAEAKINLLGLWGYASGHEEPRFSCVPESPKAFGDLLKSSGIEAEEGTTCYCSDRDRPGALVETLDRIAEAGISLDAIESVAMDDRFGCFIWTDESDREGLRRVLGIKSD